MRHPPYPWWEIAADVVWVLCFAAISLGALLAFRPLRAHMLLAVLPIALIISRLVLADHTWVLYGLIVLVFELPVIIYLVSKAILILFGFRARQGVA
jgi:hypothetical protein